MALRNNIHVGITFDSNYITLCYVLLTSIFSNNKNIQLIVHAIATDVDENEKGSISHFVNENNGEVIFYEFDKSTIADFSLKEGKHLTVATYYRLYLPGLVPEHIDKLLYLDTDIVVIGDLSDLYHTDMESKPVAAVMDPNAKSRPELFIQNENNYFNAGVLLINLSEWKNQKISERTIQFIQQYPERCRLNDQDALNAILVDNWHQLALRYNVTIFDIPHDLRKSKYKDFLIDKTIIHYTRGGHKPWKFLGKNKFRYLYHDYLKKSPRKNEKKYSDFKLKPRTLILFMKIRTEEAIVGYPIIYKAFKKISGASKKIM